jgi:hypothetical protein
MRVSMAVELISQGKRRASHQKSTDDMSTSRNAKLRRLLIDRSIQGDESDRFAGGIISFGTCDSERGDIKWGKRR